MVITTFFFFFAFCFFFCTLQIILETYLQKIRRDIEIVPGFFVLNCTQPSYTQRFKNVRLVFYKMTSMIEKDKKCSHRNLKNA